MNQIRDEFQENMEGQELLHTPGGVRDVYGREYACQERSPSYLKDTWFSGY